MQLDLKLAKLNDELQQSSTGTSGRSHPRHRNLLNLQSHDEKAGWVSPQMPSELINTRNSENTTDSLVMLKYLFHPQTSLLYIAYDHTSFLDERLKYAS